MCVCVCAVYRFSSTTLTIVYRKRNVPALSFRKKRKTADRQDIAKEREKQKPTGPESGSTPPSPPNSESLLAAKPVTLSKTRPSNP